MQKSDKINKQKLGALISLLQDKDECVASLAMEQILLNEKRESLVAELQDDAEPLLRRRIHQVSSITERRKIFQQFVLAAERGELDIWQAMLWLDRLYDNQSSSVYIESMAASLQNSYTARRAGTPYLVEFMKDNNFRVPSPDMLDVTYYLLGDVLETHEGASSVLCILAQRLAASRGWHGNICMHAGRFCLLDEKEAIIDPSKNWEVIRKSSPDAYHICTRKDLLAALLCQLFALSVVEWEPWDVYHFASLLGGMHHIDLQTLPYPLGNYQKKDANSEEKKNIKKRKS